MVQLLCIFAEYMDSVTSHAKYSPRKASNYCVVLESYIQQDLIMLNINHLQD